MPAWRAFAKCRYSHFSARDDQTLWSRSRAGITWYKQGSVSEEKACCSLSACDRSRINRETRLHSASVNLRLSSSRRLVRVLALRASSSTNVSTNYEEVKAVRIDLNRKIDYVSYHLVLFGAMKHHICWWPSDFHIKNHLAWYLHTSISLYSSVFLLALRGWSSLDNR